ncbi:sensor domain-containing diguanylate cyclase [Solemya velesiana gill symbiont]|uniref:diguanylate cyclase n=1 Tax=Solemya velesiana gill symbiont TaxID=1918948 RepID=A0A1T2KUZ0_9GAMM|nr:sensor domain-containing diguanylate cyclase [Solemya velesiana gill symbiont]OOZ36644.1 hypothetical protein BOW51_06015 [Solemya velesiana gill symbiont]
MGERVFQENAVSDAGKHAEFYRQQLNALLNRYELMPDVAQICPCIKDVLRDPGSEDDVDQANRVLEDMAIRTGVSAAYVMGLDGKTFAASNWNSAGSFVGKNYGIRPYFKTAVKGGMGRYVAIGITSRKLGYYLAKPVKEGEEILGVGVVKVGLDQTELWLCEEAVRSGVEIALLDEDGVVFLASNSDWQFRPVNALSEDKKQAIRKARRYEGSDLEALPIRQVRRLDAQSRYVHIGIADSIDYIARRIPLTGTDWYLEAYMSLESRRSEVYGYTLFGALSMLTVALLLAVVGVREMYRKQLLDVAIRDPLTGLYTRFYMNEAIPALIARHARNTSEGLTVIMFDLDHFKRVNDDYGHHAGDKVLQMVGNTLPNQLRGDDIAVRYGGEELVVFIQGGGLESGLELAERVRINVAELAVEVNHHVVSVTLSAGLAVHGADESLDSLMRRADEKLYQAKQGGRDRVCA